MKKNTDSIDRRLCVAPMMDWTDRHCRVFHRHLVPDALLFTEMVTAEAVIHGDLDRLLGHDEIEHPLVLQLGGSQPDRLAMAVERAESSGCHRACSEKSLRCAGREGSCACYDQRGLDWPSTWCLFTGPWGLAPEATP